MGCPTGREKHRAQGWGCSCSCPTHAGFWGDSVQLCCGGGRRGVCILGWMLCWEEQWQKLSETVIKKPKTHLLILCTCWKSIFISTLSSGRNLFQLAQFHCKLKKNRLDAYKTVKLYTRFVRFLIQHMIFKLMTSYDRSILHLVILTFCLHFDLLFITNHSNETAPPISTIDWINLQLRLFKVLIEKSKFAVKSQFLIGGKQRGTRRTA